MQRKTSVAVTFLKWIVSETKANGDFDACCRLELTACPRILSIGNCIAMENHVIGEGGEASKFKEVEHRRIFWMLFFVKCRKAE